MAIKPSIFNLITAPTPIIYTEQGPFILVHDTLTAYNVGEIPVDHRDYIRTHPIYTHTFWHDVVGAFMAGRYAPCGDFTTIKIQRFTWCKDEKSGLIASPGARTLFKDYEYSYYDDFLLIHSGADTLAAIIYGRIEVKE